ncbi:MAG TPA: phage protease [Accumulibacter sp.]|uniref:phage protease n=1 Tax=Accumulibacter sp. TaxID=2053492 RepID=UPI002B79D5BE|nr:phage protease [Accumulibacter sp.]HRD86776.1 phage protease [Accumulibacter sp.]
MSRCQPAPNNRPPRVASAIAALSGSDGRGAVAACAVDLSAAGSAPADFRLLPAGSFRSWDGRPQDAAAWVMTPEDGQRLVAEASARTSDRVIDYEHATIKRAQSGEKSPAAGWFRKLEWRPGSGLWAIGVQWTAQAAKHIAAREYRYLSPVFSYDEASGRVLTLLHASLTNDPGLDGLTDLAALAAELFALPPNRQEQSMPETLKKLLAALGLQDTASEAEALSAVAALKTNVATLSAQIATPDPARFVPVATLAALQAEHATVQGKLAAMTAEIDAGKVAKVVEDGLAAGKLTPATADWARTLGPQNLASLTAYLEAAPVVMKPGETQSGGKKPAGGSPRLDPGDSKAIATAALSYQAAQAASGISVSTPAAVAHVINNNGV